MERLAALQAKARVARREAEIAAERKRAKMVEGALIGFFILCIIAVLGALVALILPSGDCNVSHI